VPKKQNDDFSSTYYILSNVKMISGLRVTKYVTDSCLALI